MSVFEVESCKILFLGGHLLFTCTDTCCRMYCLPTVYNVTDGQRQMTLFCQQAIMLHTVQSAKNYVCMHGSVHYWVHVYYSYDTGSFVRAMSQFVDY